MSCPFVSYCDVCFSVCFFSLVYLLPSSSFNFIFFYALVLVVPGLSSAPFFLFFPGMQIAVSMPRLGLVDYSLYYVYKLAWHGSVYLRLDVSVAPGK